MRRGRTVIAVKGEMVSPDRIENDEDNVGFALWPSRARGGRTGLTGRSYGVNPYARQHQAHKRRKGQAEGLQRQAPFAIDQQDS